MQSISIFFSFYFGEEFNYNVDGCTIDISEPFSPSGYEYHDIVETVESWLMWLHVAVLVALQTLIIIYSTFGVKIEKQ